LVPTCFFSFYGAGPRAILFLQLNPPSPLVLHGMRTARRHRVRAGVFVWGPQPHAAPWPTPPPPLPPLGARRARAPTLASPFHMKGCQPPSSISLPRAHLSIESSPPARIPPLHLLQPLWEPEPPPLAVFWLHRSSGRAATGLHFSTCSSLAYASSLSRTHWVVGVRRRPLRLLPMMECCRYAPSPPPRHRQAVR
jgi:hypothetical protein